MNKKTFIIIIIAISIVIVLVAGVLIWGNNPQKEYSTQPKNNHAEMEMPPFDTDLNNILNLTTSSQEDSTSTDILNSSQQNVSSTDTNVKSSKNFEFKGIWISYIDIKSMALNKTADQFKAEFSNACKLIKDVGLNSLIIQVRPFSDAFYKSEIFPWSHILTGTQGQNPGYDPLQIMIDIAKENQLQVHAWINPYRIKTSEIQLSQDNPAQKYLSNDNTKNKIKQFNNGLYYNMADDEVINLITSGVEELCKNYDINGIHFDDYFYPTSDESFDKNDYENYKTNGGKLSLADWRRECVSKLIKSVYDKIKSINKNIVFGISPSGDYEKAQNSMYVDLNKWLNENGYIDYVCPQIYYGFDNQSLPFEQTKNYWIDKTKNSKLYIGLPFYKSGGEDAWAGKGINEFKENNNIISRMIANMENDGKITGYVIYDYNHIKNLNSVSKNELEELKKINKK